MASGGANGIEIEFGQSTDPGLDPNKRVNEDAAGYRSTKHGHLFVLCDGMGGHAGGREASEIAIRTIFEAFDQARPEEAASELLIRAVEEAGRQVYAFGGGPQNPQRPGSTVVTVLLHDSHVDVAHVGDSRAYAIRSKQIYRLTRDHSMVQEMLDNGVITEQEAIGHPDSNKITRALGMTAEVRVELRQEPMELYEGDVLILASDGLTDLARNDDILITVTEYLRSGDIQSVCDELVALANRRGGHDNITVQVVRILAPGTKGQTLAQSPSGLAPSGLAPSGLAPSGSAPSELASGDLGISGAKRVQTTIEGVPAGVATTVVQGPSRVVDASVQQPPPPGVVVPADPSAPSPTLVEHPSGVGMNHGYPSAPSPADLVSGAPPRRPHRDRREDGIEPQMLQRIVIGMGVVIGLLVILLIWALTRGG